jgi:hypothetical protein
MSTTDHQTEEEVFFTSYDLQNKVKEGHQDSRSRFIKQSITISSAGFELEVLREGRF